MAITIENSNYINDDYNRRSLSGTSSAGSSAGVRYQSSYGSSLSAGSTVTGQIVEKDGDQVTIRLSNDQTISAKLQGNADIEVGSKMTFEVARGANGQTALRPLFSNLNTNNAAMAALKAANLPVNANTLTMTDSMMQYGMPVNRNALAEMFRNISAHSNVSPESIVQMTKLDMPLTDSNVIQFDNYRNFEHQITNDLTNVSEGIANLLKEAVTSPADASFGAMSPSDVVREVLNLIDTDALETILPSEADLEMSKALSKTQPGTESLAAGESTLMQEEDTANAVTNEKPAPQVLPDTAGSIRSTVDGFISNLKEIFTSDIPDSQETANNSNITLTATEQSTVATDLQNIMILAGQGADIHEPLDPSQIMTAVKELLNEYPPEDVKVIEAELAAYSEEGSEAQDEAFLNDTARADINALRTARSEEGDIATPASSDQKTGTVLTDSPELAALKTKAQIHEKLTNLISSEGFTKLVRDSVKAQMSIKPETVGQNGKIDELYDRIQKTTAKITQLMESIGRDGSDTARAAGALNDNVNFMNQLGEFVSYVQLPLKMAGEDANGELYVYTNRKNLENKDGNYSALLHLDMEHLGPMDVYVTMRDHTKVSTNFYLQSEELLDFMEAHIDQLTQRLTEKGYNTTTRVAKKDPHEPITPITDEFMKDDPGEKSHMVVSQMRFDVRA